MANPQLIEYIKQARVAGVSDNDIRAKLLSEGWPRPDIEEAFSLQFFMKNQNALPFLLFAFPVVFALLLMIGVFFEGAGNGVKILMLVVFFIFIAVLLFRLKQVKKV